MAIVSCAVTKGDLPLEISWLLNGRHLSGITAITVDNSKKRVSQLSIDSVSTEHAGEYTCVARNSAGTIHFSAVLNVNCTIEIL